MEYKSLIRKLSKIVMGVIVFLCASLVLNSDVFAVDGKMHSYSFNWQTREAYFSIDVAGGISNCLGLNNNSAYKYDCSILTTSVGNLEYSFTMYGDISNVKKFYNNTCKENKTNMYSHIENVKFDLMKYKDKFRVGKTVYCKPSYYNSGKDEWKNPSADTYIFKPYEIAIYNYGLPGDAKLSVDNKWNVITNYDGKYSGISTKVILLGGYKTWVAYDAETTNMVFYNNTVMTLPELTYSGYKLKGYAVQPQDKNVASYTLEELTAKCSQSGLTKANTQYNFYNKSSIVSGKSMVVACWEKVNTQSTTQKVQNFTVTFDANGGTVSSKGELTSNWVISSDKKSIVNKLLESGATYAIKGGGSVDKLSTIQLSRSGYTFIGWNKNSSTCDSSKTYPKSYADGNIFSNVTTTTTYYACWKKNSSTTSSTTTTTTSTTKVVQNPKVTFKGNGGKSNGSTGRILTCNNTPCSFNSLDIPTFTRKDYTFLGWSTSDTCPNYSFRVSGITKDITYYACWKAFSTNSSNTTKPTTSKVSIAFYKSSGTNFTCESGYTSTSTSCSKQVNISSSIKLPNSNAYDTTLGGKFIGWTPYLNSDGRPNCTLNTIKYAGSDYKIGNSPMSFYACYKETVNATRYAMSGASADGNNIPCGSALNITYCIQSTDGNNYCYYDKVGNTTTSGKVYKNKISNVSTISSCNTTSGSTETLNKYMYVTIASLIDYPFSCGAKVYVTTCDNGICNISNFVDINGTVRYGAATFTKAYLMDTKESALSHSSCKGTSSTTTKPSNSTTKPSGTSTTKPNSSLTQTKCTNTAAKNVKGTITLNMCYNSTYSDEDVKKMIVDNNLVLCGNGYVYDSSFTRALGDAECNDKICFRNYTVACKAEVTGNSAINVETIPAFVGTDGYGSVKVKVYTKNSNVVAYYLSEYLIEPTLTSEWIPISSNSFDIRGMAGTQYIWVKDNNGNISNVSTIAILDNTTSSTTLKTLALNDGTNNIVPNVVSYLTNVGNGYALLSNNKQNREVLAQGFDAYKHEYIVDVNSPTLSVYATLTSSDASYVEGYEPRTVNLEYGTNTILIKIRNSEGKIRTYTIIANRKDDRKSDNTLRDLTVSVGKIVFNSNKTEYKIEIPKNTEKIDVNAVIGSNVANYVSGYEPSTVYIHGDVTVKLIKVISETGSLRTYVLTFIKKGADIISDESLQLFSLSIPGVNIPFESNVSNYSFSVDYTNSVIDIYSSLKDKNSQISYRVKNGINGTYKDVSSNGINLEVGENFVEIIVLNNNFEESVYRLTIIRKETGLDVSNDTTLKDLQVLGYNIRFNPKDKEYSVRIKNEKSLVITAYPTSNRSEVFIRGNEELTGFSTVRIKVVAENGDYETYSIDIKKDPFNKAIEISALIVGCVIILGSSYILFMKNKNKKKKDYYRD